MQSEKSKCKSEGRKHEIRKEKQTVPSQCDGWLWLKAPISDGTAAAAAALAFRRQQTNSLIITNEAAGGLQGNGARNHTVFTGTLL